MLNLDNTEMIECYEYYDIPLLYLSVDNTTGIKYIVFWYDYENDGEIFLYTPISDKDIDALRNKKLSLRKALIGSGSGYYLVDRERVIQLDVVDESFLPANEYFVEYITPSGGYNMPL